MSLKLVTLTSHDGKTLIKINPMKVNYLTTQEEGFTKVHFGLDQTVDVMGTLDVIEGNLCAL